MQSLYKVSRSASNYVRLSSRIRIVCDRNFALNNNSCVTRVLPPLLIHHHTLFTSKPICNKSLLELVDSSLENNGEVKDKQINLLSSVLGDINYYHSDDGQLTGDDVYKLAVVAFKASKESEADTSIVVTNLFKISHELGNVDSSFTYAQLLRIGQGCEPDPAAAAKILTDLSMKAHPYAQFSLAVMYYSGIGIEQDFKKAFTLYKVSSQNLVPQAFSALGDMYILGQGVAEDKEEAIKCYEKAVELGEPAAHLSLAQCYNKGTGVEQSFEKSFSHYLSAARAGLPLGEYNTGIHYFAGKGVEHSFEKAMEYFQKASQSGFAPAQVNLGNMYYNGYGVEKDLLKAKEYYEMAADTDENAKLLLKELEIELNELKKENIK